MDKAHAENPRYIFESELTLEDFQSFGIGEVGAWKPTCLEVYELVKKEKLPW